MVKKKTKDDSNQPLKFERKRIKKNKPLPPLCKDYEPGFLENCKKAKICKNAVLSSADKELGFCYGNK